MRSKYKLLIFDMDGTLLDSMWYWRTMWREYMDEHGLSLSDDMVGAVMYPSGKCATELAARGWRGGDREMIYREMLDKWLRHHYMTDVRPKPCVREALDSFKAEGLRLCVATATPRHLAEPALERHDLLEYFEFVTDVYEMGYPKSDARFFENVARRAGVPAGECLMFEDSLYAMRGAHDAGMDVWAIDDPIMWGDRAAIDALCERRLGDWGELTGAKPPKWRNIVLDFGNVVARFHTDDLIARFVSDPDDRALLKAAVRPRWEELDAGTRDYAAHIRESLEKLPERLHETAMRFFDGWMTTMDYVPGMPDLIASLKSRGYWLYLLSNAPVVFAEHMDAYRALDGFTGRVVSGPLKLMKPDPAIYRYLLTTYALDPARTLFVDDSARNVEGARAAGMDGYLFDGDAAALARYIEAGEGHDAR